MPLRELRGRLLSLADPTAEGSPGRRPAWSGRLLERFLRYAAVPTTSDPGSKAFPSTPGQWDLLHLLRDELEALGASDPRVTEHGYVLASLPAASGKSALPALGFLAHVDTAPDFPGTGVKPIVHRGYPGGRLVLPDDPSRVLDPEDPRHSDLREAVGKDVVTASGKTLLGADDKAGVAVIMTLAEVLLADPAIPRGPVRICFTPDEEVGRGVDRLDLGELAAEVAYTVDGEGMGTVNWETFSADEAVIRVRGVATHPGTARRYGMVNAIHLAGKLLASLPRERMSPEATDDREGFVHPIRIRGDAAETTLHLILRDHDDAKLAAKGSLVRALCRSVQLAYPDARIRCRIRPQYRNMGRWLRERMLPVDLALEACGNVGVTPSSPPTRGGTDGSRLTERGLPTPNLFCGVHNPHGPLEWVALQDMEKAVEVLVELCRLWEEKGEGFRGGGEPRPSSLTPADAPR